MHGGIAGDAVGACMRIDRVSDQQAGQAGQAAAVVCRGHAGECITSPLTDWQLLEHGLKKWVTRMPTD